jgi:hypothetical protein
MSLQSQIHSLVERLAEKFNGVDQRLGGLDRLETSAKANLVTAINEVAARTLSTTGVAYIHLQTAASAVWTVNHNLVHTSANQLLIRFAIPITGLARLT